MMDLIEKSNNQMIPQMCGLLILCTSVFLKPICVVTHRAS